MPRGQLARYSPRDQYWSERRPYRFGFAARRDSRGADTDRIGVP